MRRPFDASLAFRLALREMRGGLRGFFVFIACIALGTAAIAAINSVSRTVSATMASEGRQLLAGDIRFELTNRSATDKEREFFRSLGTVSESITMRSMVRREDGRDQGLAEVKAVDGLYPLYGTFKAVPAQPLERLLAEQPDGHRGVLMQQILLDRLGLKTGERVLLGNGVLTVTGVIENEPDAVSEGFGFAPRLLLSKEAMADTGLLQLGSLSKQSYRIRLSGTDAARAATAARSRFPDAGWAIRNASNAAPSLAENIERFTQFLTLVGLTALVVGGVGIGNAVRGYLDSRRGTIATLKCLGAPNRLILAIYFTQVMLVALIGIAAGLVAGALAPAIALPYLASVLPVSESLQIFPSALVLAAGFGLITTIAFSILPLATARDVSAVTLFRDGAEAGRGWPAIRTMLLLGLALGALAALAIYTAADRRIAISALVAIAAGFAGLRLVGLAISAVARRLPRVGSASVRLAVGNLHRPGSLTGPVVLSLGLGLALLAGLSLIDVNLRSQLTGTLAEKAPNFFFLDIQGRDREQFESLLKKQVPQGKVQAVPMLRGRIVALNGKDPQKVTVDPEGKWVLNGDRGITYEEVIPSNSRITAGSWWAKDYAGAPLVSFSEQEAGYLGLKLGDTVTVNVLGRPITATIANLRKVEWDSLSINFVMVFSPNTFRGAPHSWLATLTEPSLTPAQEAETMRAIVSAYPAITSVRVKDALDTVADLTGRLANAIRGASAVALVTSVLVLAGALAAGNRARLRDAVVLKTLGATRLMLIRTFVLEYGILGLCTALFAALAGGISAWYVIARIMKLPFVFDGATLAFTLLLGLAITIAVGLAGTWRILGQKASHHLREL